MSAILTDLDKDPDSMTPEELGLTLYNIAHNTENGITYSTAFVHKVLRNASMILMELSVAEELGFDSVQSIYPLGTK